MRRVRKLSGYQIIKNLTTQCGLCPDASLSDVDVLKRRISEWAAINLAVLAQIPLVASRHETSRHDKHDVSCETWRDVSCVLRRACSNMADDEEVKTIS